ncbi:MAG TPA: NINE protein [Mycobacterium sp.]|nr:NINE protein [Mycobacterium sp.]
MTDPSQFGSSAEGVPPRQPPPPTGYPPPIPPYPPYQPYQQYPQNPGPYPGAYTDPAAPYGRHPLTGEPFSDKSKTIAGLLQLLGLLGFLGFGRIYIGQTNLGIVQLLVGLFGGIVIGILTCGVGFLIPVIWGIVDAIVILSGNVRDNYGRPLRDG